MMQSEQQIVAAWATTAQHDDLEGCTPAAWIAQGRDNRAVVRSAEQATLRLGRGPIRRVLAPEHHLTEAPRPPEIGWNKIKV